MQVSLNLSPTKTNFKGYKNAKMPNYPQSEYSPKPLSRPLKLHNSKNIFQKLVEKLGFIENIKESALARDTYIINYDKRLTNNGGKDYFTDVEEINRTKSEIGIDIEDRLFIASTRDSMGRPTVIFNTFFINDKNEQVVRLYKLFTDTTKMTDTQKMAYKLFYNAQMRSKIALGSRNNPMKDVDVYKPKTLEKLRKIANSISDQHWDEMSQLDNGRALGPVIYSADGVDEIWFYKSK